MIVMKFGGTSVQDAAAIQSVCNIVGKETKRNPLVVVSACAGVTNALIEAAHLAANGAIHEALDSLASLRKRHSTVGDRLLTIEAPAVRSVLARQAAEVGLLLREVAGHGCLYPEALDAIVAYGEIWSSTLLTAALRETDAPSELVDARSLLITDGEVPANPLMDAIEANVNSVLRPRLQKGLLVVTQGFIGATVDGRTTTLGRGGSDYSASLLGAALDAEEIQIWTDVDGILTSDPSIVPEARQIKEMTFQEAAELAYFGARVLHPGTILPAISKGIPVRVLNSKKTGGGTLITGQTRSSRNGVVKSIAYKERITTVTLKSTRKLMNYGFLARVFAVFEKHKKSIDVVATSEVGVSLTVDNNGGLEAIVEELSTMADVQVLPGRAVLCVVGERIKYAKGIASRVFRALSDADVNIELISHGGSEINLTFVIREDQIERAVTALHHEFFPRVADLEEALADQGKVEASFPPQRSASE